MRSNSGQLCMNSRYCGSVQKPSRAQRRPGYTTAIKENHLPAAGKWATYLWKYHCVVSRSVGVVSATTWQTRGWRLGDSLDGARPCRRVTALNSTITRSFSWRIHSCSLTAQLAAGSVRARSRNLCRGTVSCIDRHRCWQVPACLTLFATAPSFSVPAVLFCACLSSVFLQPAGELFLSAGFTTAIIIIF